MKYTNTIRAREIECKCPHCDEWTPWKGDSEGCVVECDKCGKVFEVSDIYSVEEI